MYLPGARMRAMDSSDVGELLDPFRWWVPCLGGIDGLLAPSEEGAAKGVPRGVFEEFVSQFGSPFAWLVVATPLPPGDLKIKIRDVDITFRHLLLGAADLDEAARIRLVRRRAWRREYTRAGVYGLWDVRIMVGSTTGPAAAAAATVLCGSSALDGLPYRLVPDRPVPGLATALTTRRLARDTVDATEMTEYGRPDDGNEEEGGEEEEDGGAGTATTRFPFVASTDLMAALVRPPSRELPGIRLEAPNTFDVTPEHTAADGIRLGDVLDPAYLPAEQFSVSRTTLNSHVFVCGATGSGKSHTVRGLLEQLARPPRPRRVPWLVIEPAKSEYAQMAGRLDQPVVVIAPGDPLVPPASLNPLEPEPFYPLASHVDLVRELFAAAFEAVDPFPQVLQAALAKVYADAGWNSETGAYRGVLPPSPKRGVAAGRPHYPTMADLQATADEVVKHIGYGPEVRDNVRGLVKVRIGSLRSGPKARFFEGGHPLDMAKLMGGHAVIELDRVTSGQEKAFFMGTILIRMFEHLHVRHREQPATGLEHVTVLEEAHRLLARAERGTEAAAVQVFTDLLAEIRALGEGLVVVEQIPSKIVPDVVKNTALKIMHRLPAQDDRTFVGASMNLTDTQSELVVALPRGRAAVAADEMDRPVLVQMDPVLVRMDDATPDGDRREPAGRQPATPPLSCSRSRRCPPDCWPHACTGVEIEHARLDVADHPLVVVWVEAVTAAYVSGRELPGPSDEVRAQVQVAKQKYASDRRLAGCAVAQAADRAVTARRRHLQRWYDPDDFGDVLGSTLTAQLRGDPVHIDGWWRWMAGYKPYTYVSRYLRLHVEEGVPLPDHFGELWDRLNIVGPWTGANATAWTGRAESAEAARAAVMKHPGYRRSKAFITGDPRASGLEVAVEALASPSRDGVAQALRQACTHHDHLFEIADQFAEVLSFVTPTG
jgi:hypothetical protein